MDPAIIYKKLDELSQKFEKLREENTSLKNDLNSVKKIISTKYSASDIIKENVFVNHKTNTDYLNVAYTDYPSLKEYYSNLEINREQLLCCFNNFSTGLGKIFKHLVNDDNCPLVSFKFARKTYTYNYNGSEWEKTNDVTLIEFVRYVIKKLVFQEFTKWQKENETLIKNNPQEASDYHSNLMRIINTPTALEKELKKLICESVILTK